MKLLQSTLLAATAAVACLFAMPEGTASTARADYFDRRGRQAQNHWQRQGNYWERQGRQTGRQWSRGTNYGPRYGYRSSYRGTRGRVNVGPVRVYWR